MSGKVFEDYVSAWKPDIRKSDKPLYIAIAEQLEEDIKKGIVTPGTKLPSQRDLANYLEINLSTISRAFKLCIEKGIISATVGKGTFVSSDVNADNYLLPERETEKIIDLGAMTTNYDSNQIITDQLKKMTFEPDFYKLFNYGRVEGSFFQKEAAVKYIKRVKYEVEAKNILLSAGGQNAITAILASLFERGDRIGTNQFIYPGIKTAAKMLGIQLVPIKETNGRISEDALLYAHKNEKIKGIYLIPDYQNPTGITMLRKERKMIGEFAQKNNLIIIEDGIFSLVSETPIEPIAVYAPGNTVFIMSLSKVIAPGLRLGFVVVPERHKVQLSKGLYNMNISVSPLMAELASRIINSSVLDQIITYKQDILEKRNKIIDKYLERYSISSERYSMFRWINLPEGAGGENFEARAYKEGVQVYSAERFVVGKAKAEKAVRISLTAAKSTEEFERGVKIIKSLIEGKEELAIY